MSSPIESWCLQATVPGHLGEMLAATSRHKFGILRILGMLGLLRVLGVPGVLAILGIFAILGDAPSPGFLLRGSQGV